MPVYKALQRSRLLGLLGDLPQLSGPVAARLVNVENRGSYMLENLVLELNGLEPVPACFARPKQATGKLPVMLFNHSHGGIHAIGKDELLRPGGKGYLQAPDYAEFLTGLGYGVLSFDAWGFGERSDRTESEIFKQMLWNGQVMWGMMVYDGLRAIDYLCARSDVDAGRIGTIGISMGGTMAWWLAALDERIRFCVDMCSLADYDAIVETGVLDIHGIYYYVPGLAKQFTAGQINALISPRPHLGFAGARDKTIPVSGLARIDRETKAAYAADGAGEAWQLIIGDAGHEETPEMRATIHQFLLDQLQLPSGD